MSWQILYLDGQYSKDGEASEKELVKYFIYFSEQAWVGAG